MQMSVTKKNFEDIEQERSQFPGIKPGQVC